MADVVLDGVTKRFGAVTAVRDLSLTVKDGEFVVLLGPTGAGKTTTLRLVAGLEAPDEGGIRIGGANVTGAAPAERDVAFVFQQYSLYPHYTVFENLAFPLRAPGRRWPVEQIRARVRRSRACCASKASCRIARPGSLAARCSASRSAARSCATPQSSSWTSRSPRSMPSCARSFGSS